MRTAPRLVGALVAAVLPLPLMVAAPSYGAAAEPPHVDVVADELPSGPAPRWAYVDDANQLVRPGGTTVSGLGEQVYSPARVRGGYLVGAQTPRATNRWYDDTLLVPDHGRTRRIMRQPWAGADNFALGRSKVSGNGRLVAMLRGGYNSGDGVVVKRVSDGSTIARRPNFDGRILAFQGRRVLVLRDYPKPKAHPRLLWWNIDADRMTTVLKAPRYRLDHAWTGVESYPRAGAPAANLSTGQVALLSGRREVVRPLPGHRGRTWHTDRSELVQSWSPDDRLVLTAVDPGPFSRVGDLPQTATLRIRRAATGVVVGEFRGLVAVDTEFHGNPVWETSGTLLTSAWSDYVPDDFRPELTGRREIRCTVSSLSCETVLPEVAPGISRSLSLWAARQSS